MELCGAKVKGSSFSVPLQYVAKTYGADRLKKALERLPEQMRSDITRGLPSLWYPVEYVGELTSALRMELGPRDPNFVFQLTTNSAKQTFGAVYKLFIRLGSPEFIVGRIAAVYRTMCDTGELQVIDKQPRQITMRLTGFPYRNPDYCGHQLRGWFQGPLELSGCKIVENVHTICACRGSPHCEWRVRWE